MHSNTWQCQELAGRVESQKGPNSPVFQMKAPLEEWGKTDWVNQELLTVEVSKKGYQFFP